MLTQEYLELKESAKSLSEKDRWIESLKLAVVWEIDWDLYKCLYYEKGLSFEEVQIKKREYELDCNKILKEIYGYESMCL